MVYSYGSDTGGLGSDHYGVPGTSEGVRAGGAKAHLCCLMYVMYVTRRSRQQTSVEHDPIVRHCYVLV